MKQDISKLLTAETENTTNSDLPTISVWQLAVYYLMFFMTEIDKFSSHFDPDSRKSFLCLGGACPACAAGLKLNQHIYLPVWDVQSRRVVVLRLDSRNDGPARKIAQFIETYRGTLHDIVAVIDCKGDQKGTFTITAHAPIAETDRGALASKAFCDALEAGAIDLRCCVQRLSVEDVAKLASVKKVSTKLVGEPVAPSAPVPAADSIVGLPIGEQEA